GISIFERPSPDFEPYRAVYERFGAMAGHLEPMRRRLVNTPLGLDHPYWIDDPDFDLDYHVRHIGIPPPGSDEQLCEQICRIVGRHMDRNRPLWEVYVIEGLPDDKWAMLTKYHHATIDGASGVLMLRLITEATQGEDFEFEPIEWSGEAVPADSELMKRTVTSLLSNPVKSARLQLKIVRQLAEAAGIDSVSGAAAQAREVIKSLVSGGDGSDGERNVSIPITPAPPTPWNANVSPNRRFAMRSVPLSDIKALKDATGGTINDVVMAICTGGLRAYLDHHGVLPDEPLRAMVPVSIRTGDEADPWTNRVSAIVAELPTDCPDPLERVERCRDAMDAAKRQFELVPAEAMMEATQVTSPVIAASALRLVNRLRLANRVNTPVNVVISNVPGPRESRWFGESELVQYVPVSTIADNVGLNITVHSYRDTLAFGLIADRELVPDLWDLMEMHDAEVDRLFTAAGLARSSRSTSVVQSSSATAPAGTSSEQRTASAKKASSKKATAKKTSAKKTSAKKASPKKSASRNASAEKASAKKRVAAG
ncbi:MAG: wax ester/triacylglycerol synthase family O-acyltransferase, partial [Actinomycetota bacterium]